MVRHLRLEEAAEDEAVEATITTMIDHRRAPTRQTTTNLGTTAMGLKAIMVEAEARAVIEGEEATRIPAGRM